MCSSDLTSIIRQLKRHWPAGLVLDDRCPHPHGSTEHDIAPTKPDEITTRSLAIDCEMEHRPLSHASVVPQSCPDRPDVTRLQWWFRTYDAPGIQADADGAAALRQAWRILHRDAASGILILHEAATARTARVMRHNQTSHARPKADALILHQRFIWRRQARTIYACPHARHGWVSRATRCS